VVSGKTYFYYYTLFHQDMQELTADVNSFQGIHVCSHWLDLGDLHSHLLDCWSFKVSLKLIKSVVIFQYDIDMFTEQPHFCLLPKALLRIPIGLKKVLMQGLQQLLLLSSQ